MRYKVPPVASEGWREGGEVMGSNPPLTFLTKLMVCETREKIKNTFNIISD